MQKIQFSKLKPSTIRLTDKKSKSITDYRHKHLVFDREKPSYFKDWQDNIFDALEIEEIEKNVSEAWDDKEMLTKVSTELHFDNTGNTIIAKRLKQKSLREEINKSKAHVVRVSKDFPKRLIMKIETPHEARVDFKIKHLVAKNFKDVKNLDNE